MVPCKWFILIHLLEHVLQRYLNLPIRKISYDIGLVTLLTKIYVIIKHFLILFILTKNLIIRITFLRKIFSICFLI